MRFLDLGSLLIDVNDGPVAPGGRRPATVLSALLVYLNQRVSVETLLAAVWGDDVPPERAGTLETHIWRLRRILEPGRGRGQPAKVLINDAGGYRLAVPAEQVDSVMFQKLSVEVVDLLATSQPDRALRRVDDALSLWRGRPYDIVADDYWAAGAVARLTEVRAQLQEHRVDALLAVGDATGALADLQSLLGEHEFRERLWWQQMLALYRLGRVEESLQVYRGARRRLLDGVGVEPGVELKELHSRVLNQDPDLQLARPTSATTSRPIPVHLPRPIELVGRQADQDEITALVDQHALVTLVGAAGCGKTRLATEVARSRAPRHPDGVWFVDLSVVERDETVPDAVLAAIGSQLPPVGSATLALTTQSRERRMLIVLDNCEQVLTGCLDLCHAVLVPNSEVSILATSREAIGFPAERVRALDPLAVADVAHTSPAGKPSPATQLFIRQASRANPRLVFGPAELGWSAEIGRAVDGLPLAIELSAALTEAFPLPDIVRLVNDDPSQLASIGRQQAPHHATVHAAIERGYQTLSEHEQLLHRRLSVLPGPFSPEVAIALVADTDISAWSVRGLLARLVHRSMLAVADNPDGPGGRFVQLATVRGHAARALTEAGEVEAAIEQRDQWTMLLVQAQPRPGRVENADWLDAVATDIVTVQATLHQLLVATPDPRGGELAGRLLAYWYYRGLAAEGRRWLELAIDLESRLDHADRGWVRLSLAGLLAFQGQRDRAAALVHTELADGVADPPTLDRYWLLLATTTFVASTGDAVTAARLLDVLAGLRKALREPDVDVLYEAVACFVGSLSLPLPETATRASASYAAAMEVGNLWAAWLSCSSANGVALVLRDADEGLLWSRRLVTLQRRLGMRAAHAQLETYGIFLALSGAYEHAVLTFSATRAQSRLDGTVWPRNGLTSELMGVAAERLGTEVFNQAWAEGPTRSIDDLIGAAD